MITKSVAKTSDLLTDCYPIATIAMFAHSWGDVHGVFEQSVILDPLSVKFLLKGPHLQSAEWYQWYAGGHHTQQGFVDPEGD